MNELVIWTLAGIAALGLVFVWAAIRVGAEIDDHQYLDDHGAFDHDPNLPRQAGLEKQVVHDFTERP